MSGGGSKTVEQKSEPPDWARPYAWGMLDRASAITNQPYSPRVAPFSQDQNNAFQMIRQASEDPFTKSYNQKVGQTLSDYAGGNYLDITKAPGFQDALDRASQAYSTGTAAQTAAAFNSGAGPLGDSTAYRETMGVNNRAFADSLQRLIGDQYNTQQGMQLQAASALPQYLQAQYINPNALSTIGQQQQAYQNSLLSDAYDYPREQLDIFGNAYSRAIGGAGSTYSPNPARGNTMAGALGGGLLGYGAAGLLGLTGPVGWGVAGAGALAGGLLS